MSTGEDKELFREAVAQLLQELTFQLHYRPTEYRRLIREHGELEAARILQYQPQSEDSLAIAARGRADLTMEALVCGEAWTALFTDEEREIARVRYKSFTPPRLATEKLPSLDNVNTVVSASFSSPVLSEVPPVPISDSLDEDQPRIDDLVWGEELLEGIDVCEKLRTSDVRLGLGPQLFASWVWAIFREHLRNCAACTENCRTIVLRIAEMDGAAFEALAGLLPQVEKAFKLDLQRADDLLSREWKSAGYGEVPSNRDDGDPTETGFYRPHLAEWQQRSAWLEVMEWRAVVLCWYAGGRMLEFEDTHEFNVVPQTSVAGDAHLWLLWSKGEHDKRAQSFVSGLGQSRLHTALLARHVASVLGPSPLNTQLVIPTDGDLNGVSGVLKVEDAPRIEDWTRILGLPTRGLNCRALLQLSSLAAQLQVGPLAAAHTAVDVSNVWRELNGILDWVEGRRDRTPSVSDRIGRAVAGGLLPRPIALLMHTVRQFRNIAEHDDHQCSQKQLMMVSLAWEEIRDWAQAGGWKPSRRAQ